MNELQNSINEILNKNIFDGWSIENKTNEYIDLTNYTVISNDTNPDIFQTIGVIVAYNTASHETESYIEVVYNTGDGNDSLFGVTKNNNVYQSICNIKGMPSLKPMLLMHYKEILLIALQAKELFTQLGNLNIE